MNTEGAIQNGKSRETGNIDEVAFERGLLYFKVVTLWDIIFTAVYFPYDNVSGMPQGALFSLNIYN